MTRRLVSLFIMSFILTVVTGNIPAKADETARPEVRAIWVDAFHDGAKTPEQIDKLIQDCLKANINTVIVQVRRRGDAYYNQSIEPRTEDPVLPAGFDALQYLIDKAHANQIEVHAWLNTLVAWNSPTPPKDPNHVWNLHGSQAGAAETWVSFYRTYDKVSRKWSDKLYSSYFLDPGNPDALDYTVNVYLNVVRNYNVDGIHLDYSRYDGTVYGYNPVSVARFNARYGTAGLPEPGDPRWAEWRREQTANLVRKIYLNAIAVKPAIKVSSAVITWGDGPIAESDWSKSRAYVQVYQDWDEWLREGILDMAVPMNYFNEWSATQKQWYDRWIEWEKDHSYGRQVVIGPGAFSQYIDQTVEQIRRAEEPSQSGKNAAGVALFAYGWNNLYGNDDLKGAGSGKGLPRQPYSYMPETNDWIFPLLSKGGSYIDPAQHVEMQLQSVFPQPAPIPEMPWKTHPAEGCLMGVISGADGTHSDHVKVTVESLESNGFAESAESEPLKIHREVYTDGSGWFGLTKLPPGQYKVWCDNNNDARTIQNVIDIQAGKVTEVNLSTD